MRANGREDILDGGQGLQKAWLQGTSIRGQSWGQDGMGVFEKAHPARHVSGQSAELNIHK